MYLGFFRVIAKRAPKGGHGGVHGIVADDHVFPHEIQQFIDAQYLACPLCEANQQLHRLGFELDRVTFFANLIHRGIHTQVSDPQYGRLAQLMGDMQLNE